MTNFKAIETVEEAMYTFALSYSWDNDLVFATQMGGDCIDTLEEVDLYEKEILKFISGKKEIKIKRMNDDCTWRTEVVKIKLN